MPEWLENLLKRRAKAKGFGEKRTGAYVYGTLRKTGWKPAHEGAPKRKKKKGKKRARRSKSK